MTLLHKYFSDWIELYKVGAVRDVTLRKYRMSARNLEAIAPDMELESLDKRGYQALINQYAASHCKVTTRDWHRQVGAAIRDAVDEGLLPYDPTRKAVIKGAASPTRNKFLGCGELAALLAVLPKSGEADADCLIIVLAKTGVRFAEALGITPDDIDLDRGQLSITKTLDYKTCTGFAKTKNESSKRVIPIDGELVNSLRFTAKLPATAPIFVPDGERIFNSTFNDHLAQRCLEAGVPIITAHGLRHTHASILLFAGVNIASVSRRLGHSNINTTQSTYLHVIRELEAKDNQAITDFMGAI